MPLNCIRIIAEVAHFMLCLVCHKNESWVRNLRGRLRGERSLLNGLHMMGNESGDDWWIISWLMNLGSRGTRNEEMSILGTVLPLDPALGAWGNWKLKRVSDCSLLLLHLVKWYLRKKLPWNVMGLADTKKHTLIHVTKSVISSLKYISVFRCPGTEQKS